MRHKRSIIDSGCLSTCERRTRGCRRCKWCARWVQWPGRAGAVGSSAHCLTMSRSAALAVPRGCSGAKIFSESTPGNHPCRESQGARSKRAERVFVPCDQVAPEAQARRPLRESLPPSLRSSNESAGLQGYGFTRLRSPKFLGETNGSGRTFLSEVKCAPKLTGPRRRNGAGDLRNSIYKYTCVCDNF